MRLDKLLADHNLGTRSELKKLIKTGCVTINGVIVKNADYQVKEQDQVAFKGQLIETALYRYFMLHKPQGVITATEDHMQKTVMDLLGPLPCKNLAPVGRLDKDTEGFLLITNDGQLAHRLLSPKHHVDKCYEVHGKNPISDMDIQHLCDGVDIGDDTPTLPAKCERIEASKILLTITEGRYHQIKRMLQSIDNEVIYLKRLSFGPLVLDDTLSLGSFRELTADEIDLLKKADQSS